MAERAQGDLVVRQLSVWALVIIGLVVMPAVGFYLCCEMQRIGIELECCRMEVDYCNQAQADMEMRHKKTAEGWSAEFAASKRPRQVEPARAPVQVASDPGSKPDRAGPKDAAAPASPGFFFVSEIWCPWCPAAKAAARRAGIQFDVVTIEESVSRYGMKRPRSIPLLVHTSDLTGGAVGAHDPSYYRLWASKYQERLQKK